MPEDPPSRALTARDRLIETLREGFATIGALALRTQLTESRVRSLLEELSGLERDEPVCRKCGHRVQDGATFAAPARCPACRSDQVDPPRFRLV